MVRARRLFAARGLATCLFLGMIAARPAAGAEKRLMTAEDLFRIRRVGSVAWSADGRHAAIEISRPGRSLDRNVPSNELLILDTRDRSVRRLTPGAAYLGYFNAVWSPDGKRLAFLSVDRNAVVCAWIWRVGAAAPARLPRLDLRVGFGDAPLAWADRDRLICVAWDAGATKSGLLYFRILHGRNAADQWKLTQEGRAAVTVLESGRPAKPLDRSLTLLSLDLRTHVRLTLARGLIHQMRVSADGASVTFLQENPPIPGRSVSSVFAASSDVDELYDAVNWGSERHTVDSRTGAEIAPPSAVAATPGAVTKPAARPTPPRPEARRLSASPSADAALFVANTSEGTTLWLGGGGGRPVTDFAEIWHGNAWVRELETGRPEPIAYKAADGSELTAWLLLPPRPAPGARVPMVTIIYPGLTYEAGPPSSLNPLNDDFEHPQLFAALGYAVLLPSMPEAKSGAEALASLSGGVLPALDAAIGRGDIDPDRIAVAGQSAGGYSVLGLIGQTSRFRSAIASASTSDLVSLYGTFYGQYRNGDAGPPQVGQMFRMLMMERGSGALAGPPWAQLESYRRNSPLLRADKIETPLMLIHGDLDFIPIQQPEELFTALYRQDKRVRFVRYPGEWHTIAGHADVLDLWQRLADWLEETMAPRDGH